MTPADIEIRPLTPARRTDFLDFFEQRAFTDNPKWLSCYCHFDEPEPLADRIGAIACFVIAAAFRGRGVATALLGAACVGLREQGFEWAEAYPSEAATGSAENHHGPLAMYTAAGFEIFKRDDDGDLTVRKRLLAAAP